MGHREGSYRTWRVRKVICYRAGDGLGGAEEEEGLYEAYLLPDLRLFKAFLSLHSFFLSEFHICIHLAFDTAADSASPLCSAVLSPHSLFSFG